MADQDSSNAPPSVNVFDQLGGNDVAPAAINNGQPPNPFDSVGPEIVPQSSPLGAFGRAAMRGVLPSLGGLGAAGFGGEVGGLVGSAGGPWGRLIGTIGGAIGGGFAGSAAIEKAQEWALSKLPDSWVEALGQDDRQQRIDESQQPVASFLGGLAPYALSLTPGAIPKAALPANATAFQRIMANPITARVFGGTAMGGMELGQEEFGGEHRPDWTRVAIATGFGTIFNRPTKLGETITEWGAAPARQAGNVFYLSRALHGAEPGAPTASLAPEARVQPGSEPESLVGRNAVSYPGLTIAQAGDAKVMGPGITEDVFQGAHEQAPTAAMTAQDAVRSEDTVLGRAPQADPDLHELARRLEPELFQHYDALSAQRDEFRTWIDQFSNPPQEQFDDLAAQRQQLEARLAEVPTTGAGQNKPLARQLRAQIRDVQAQADALRERRDAWANGTFAETPETAAARARLMEADQAMRDLAPEVAAAYRRAADMSATELPEVAPESASDVAERGAEAVPEPPPSGSEGAAAPVANANPAATEPLPRAAAPPVPAGASIAEDVARQLIAAGRPAEEARAAGQLIAQRYITRAGRFGGALGTPEELYAREGALIRGPNGAAPRTTIATAPRVTIREAVLPREQTAASYLAQRGGLARTPELEQILDKNPVIPGAGRLLRNKGGLSLDDALQALKEGGYLVDPGDLGGEARLTDQDVLDLIDKEARGQKVYPLGSERNVPERATSDQAEREYAQAAGAIQRAYSEAGYDPRTMDMDAAARAVQFIQEGLETDPLRAYERAEDERARMHDYSEFAGIEPEDFFQARETPVAEIKGDEIAPKDADVKTLRQAARDYYNSNLKGTSVFSQALGRDVEFRGSRKAFSSSANPDKLRLFAALRDIIANGTLHATAEPRRPMQAGTAFHFLKAIVQTADGPREVGVTIREDRNGNLYYNHSMLDEEGRPPSPLDTPAHEGEPVDEEAAPEGLDRSEAGRGSDESGGALNQNIAPDDDGINLSVSAPGGGRLKRGQIRFVQGRKPVITLARDANASTFIHETGHQWLEELMRDAEHPLAPDVLKDDSLAIRDWLGVNEASEIKTRHHEKFARGFEQYMREGVAPTRGLANVFAKFRGWLLSIYQSLRGLGKPINDEVRGVFDRLIAMEPERAVIAPDMPKGPTLADIHEADAAETEPHEAMPAADRIAFEAQRFIQELPEGIRHEIETAAGSGEGPSAEPGAGAEPGREATASPGERGPLQPGGERPGAIPVGSMGGKATRPLGEGGTAASAESSGLSGTAAGSRSGRAASPAEQLAPQSAELFGPRESPWLDRAGNIRLDTLTSDQDVARAIHAAADENDDFIGDRRGVISDGQVEELADALGMTAQSLSRRKLGQAFNAEQIMAARKLLIHSATDVAALMKRVAMPESTDQDVMAYAMAKDRHQMIQAHVAGITAEAGRALRAFRNIAGQETALGVDQFLRQATGKTLFQLRNEAALGAQFDFPFQVSKFLLDAQSRSFGRMLLEYWINGLISGPATHTTYMMGNVLLALEKAGPETAAAALIGQVRKAFGRQGEGVHMGEILAQLGGAGRGMAPALRAGGEAFRSGVTTLLPGETPRPMPFQGTPMAASQLDEATRFRDLIADTFGLMRGLRDGFNATAALVKAGGIEGEPMFGLQYSPLGAIPDVTMRGINVLPVGTAARLPGRFIAAIHSFFRSVNYSMEKSALAYRQAAGEGLTGNAFDARVGDLWQSPPVQMMEAARHEATELTLMGEGGQFTKALSKLTNAAVDLPLLGDTQILKFIDPFVHISSNVIEQSLVQRTPLGLLSPAIRADLMSSNNAIADKAAARMLVGTALSLTFGGLAAEGLVSGSGPSDPRQAAMWRLAGNQAHSVRIGDTWYDVHRLGPLGMLMGVAADMYEVAHQVGKEDMATVGKSLMHAITQNILDESFMRGPADLIKAVEDPGRYGQAYIRNFLASFVPYSVGMAQVARAIDPYSRQARTIMDAVKQHIPGLSEQLLPRRDVWGEPMPSREALLAPGVTAIYEQKISQDPVNQAMIKLGIAPAQVKRTIRNVPLTDQQYDDFARISGRMAKQRLDVIVRSPDFATWPAHVQHDVITEVIKQSREAASGIMMMQYPTIVQAATAAKLAKIRGETAH